MIADVHITDKSFGDKQLMSDVKFSVNDGEKVGLVGRNGVGKSTLFGMLAGTDSDYRGSVVFRRGSTIVATAQEHHSLGDITVLEYILRGLPEYARLRHLGDEPVPERYRILQEHQAALKQKQQELDAHQEFLERKLAWYRKKMGGQE